MDFSVILLVLLLEILQSQCKISSVVLSVLNDEIRHEAVLKRDISSYAGCRFRSDKTTDDILDILDCDRIICIGNSMICSDIWHKYHE